nr:Isoxanthopterin deaminase [Klebsiella pneumoniae]
MAKLARQLGIRLHSHLSETVDYLDAARQKFAMTPVQFCAEHDWLGNDVWFAHLVKLLPEEIALLGRAGTGIAHCPQSNGRLGSGIADLLALEQAGVPVSLGWTAPPRMKRRICKAKPMPHGCCSARARDAGAAALRRGPLRVGPMRPRWRM